MNTISYPNAKINIGLNIVEKRSDGYHNLETIFYPINLCDKLSMSENKNNQPTSLKIEGLNIDGDNRDNLIMRAYRAIATQHKIPEVTFILEKKIPMGAGLGGGSADAAFALKMLNNHFELNISEAKLEDIATKLGADCPFFIKNKAVYATGIGNIFTPLNNFSINSYKILVIKPNIHISTQLAFSGIVPNRSTHSLTELIKEPVSRWQNSIKNDFESNLFKLFPQIAEIKKQLYKLGAEYASMSGSGSAVYGLFKEKIPSKIEFNGCEIFEG